MNDYGFSGIKKFALAVLIAFVSVAAGVGTLVGSVFL